MSILKVEYAILRQRVCSLFGICSSVGMYCMIIVCYFTQKRYKMGSNVGGNPKVTFTVALSLLENRALLTMYVFKRQ